MQACCVSSKWISTLTKRNFVLNVPIVSWSLVGGSVVRTTIIGIPLRPSGSTYYQPHGGWCVVFHIH